MKQKKSQVSLFTGDNLERKCHQNEKPLSVQSDWTISSDYHKFVLRRATRSVSNQVRSWTYVLNKIILLFQFPEESCVDEYDKIYRGYSSSDSICSEIEDAFFPPQVTPSSSFYSHSNQSPTVFTSKLPQMTLSSLSQSIPGSETSPSPVRIFRRPPFPAPKTGKMIRLIKPRVIKKSSFGSVTSETNSEESGHFFYI